MLSLNLVLRDADPRSTYVVIRFKSIGATKISNPRQTVFTLDHDVQNRSKTNLSKYARIEAFAQSHGIDFYPAGRGIGHQIMIEEGYAFPGVMTVASDSHSNMYGGVGCVGTPIVRCVTVVSYRGQTVTDQLGERTELMRQQFGLPNELGGKYLRLSKSS